MSARASGIEFGLSGRAAALLLGCAALAACAQPAPPVHWAKAGVDAATTARELQACRAQASGILAQQQGINADITATLGGSWQLSNTYQLQTQSLNRSAAGAYEQAVANCMRVKGFSAAT